MFDIREYYHDDERAGAGNPGYSEIDDNISSDIESIVKGDACANRFDKLYKVDRYKTEEHAIDILSPVISYPGSRSVLLSSDRIRSLLSFFPLKEKLDHVAKIVLKPSFIEVGGIELSAIYLRNIKTVVIYLNYPQTFGDTGKSGNETEKKQDLLINPFWKIIASIDNNSGNSIDKFFVKRDRFDNKIHALLSDISFFYKRHGY